MSTVGAALLSVLLNPWAVTVWVPLVTAWAVAAVVAAAPEGEPDVSNLDAWDNGLAHVVGANCCGGEVVAKVADWTLCADHNLAA